MTLSFTAWTALLPERTHDSQMKLSQGNTLTTISASIQLHTKGDIAVPSLRIDSHKASSDWWYYSISYCVINVVVSAEKLKGKKREKFKGVQWILIRFQNFLYLLRLNEGNHFLSKAAQSWRMKTKLNEAITAQSRQVANTKGREIHTVCYGSRYLLLRKAKRASFSQHEDKSVQMQDILAFHKITMVILFRPANAIVVPFR